ncbi:MAG: hypothetical protein FWG48_02820 [Oscillospiraceae bacterium]|nr:hypothetical protein [Oscillospiraceae bacterium]
MRIDSVNNYVPAVYQPGVGGVGQGAVAGAAAPAAAGDDARPAAGGNIPRTSPAAPTAGARVGAEIFTAPDVDYKVEITAPKTSAPEMLLWQGFPNTDPVWGPAYILDVSPEAFDAHAAGPAAGAGGTVPGGAADWGGSGGVDWGINGSTIPGDAIPGGGASGWDVGGGASGWDAGGGTVAPPVAPGLGLPPLPGSSGTPDAQSGGLPAPDISMKASGASPVEGAGECATCASRKYVDRSNDGSVSFQAPTHISPNRAAAAVAAHEGEHVSHEQAKAQRDDRKVVSQTVRMHSSVCPECGKVYISGGETRTVTVGKSKQGAESDKYGDKPDSAA